MKQYPLTLEELTRNYTLEELCTFKLDLEQILKRYDSDIVAPDAPLRLVDKTYDFMVVLLQLRHAVGEVDQLRRQNIASHASVKQLQELIELLRAYKGFQIAITFKVSGKKLTVDDRLLSTWIRNKLITAAEEFDIPVEFGPARYLIPSVNNPFRPEKQQYVNAMLQLKPHPFGLSTRKICDGILHYLKTTFNLVNHNAQYASGRQIALFYSCLALLKVNGYHEFDFKNEEPCSTDIDNLYSTLKHHNTKSSPSERKPGI
jgi:hypothetical protein